MSHHFAPDFFLSVIWVIQSTAGVFFPYTWVVATMHLSSYFSLRISKMEAIDLWLLDWESRVGIFFFTPNLFSKSYRSEKFLKYLTHSFFFKFYFIFKLYIIVLVLPNIKMNPPQVYMCSPSWTLLPPPSPYYPSGSSQCTSPKHPVSCIEPGLATRFIHDILHV